MAKVSNRSFFDKIGAVDPTESVKKEKDIEKNKSKQDQDPGLLVMQLAFEARANTHYWHLQTTSQATHEVLKKFYEGIIDEVDEFLESYIGAYGRFRGNVNLEVQSLPGEEAPALYMEEMYTKFHAAMKHPKVESRPDLVHAVEEILELIAKISYQLTLK